MPPQIDRLPSAGYAAFRLRFRALLLDFCICAAIFLIGGLVAGGILETHPLGRSAAFVGLITAVLLYEPVLVSRYGSTLGHRALNIRVVDARSQQNLSFPRAVVRSIVKKLAGVFSLAFMFVTVKAQSLHDLAAGSEVRIRNPRVANVGHYFVPETLPAGSSLPSASRRLLVILMYVVTSFLLMSVVAGLSVSSACLELNRCTTSEEQAFSLMSILWLVLATVLMSLGWHGRLPGCRRRRA
jgi:uncharacterized RDD family membrane protein YckC